MIFLYYFRRCSNDNEALFSLFDFGNTCLFPFGDTRYQLHHLIGSNTCINNKARVLISIATGTIPMLLYLYKQELFGT